ncbi:hypothetical protein NPX13_g5928 [Xylaria arbuscula]|uniref:Uncharacterized protein n=1 Tax=Xylaria arbuscula TaxID=114810 RepID=A0A9W8TKL0_9PEZI|nr:hypothetical protein NPX13_g5928 [Xylaria arbuscula]
MSHWLSRGKRQSAKEKKRQAQTRLWWDGGVLETLEGVVGLRANHCQLNFFLTTISDHQRRDQREGYSERRAPTAPTGFCRPLPALPARLPLKLHGNYDLWAPPQPWNPPEPEASFQLNQGLVFMRFMLIAIPELPLAHLFYPALNQKWRHVLPGAAHRDWGCQVKLEGAWGGRDQGASVSELNSILHYLDIGINFTANTSLAAGPLLGLSAPLLTTRRGVGHLGEKQVIDWLTLSLVMQHLGIYIDSKSIR